MTDLATRLAFDTARTSVVTTAALPVPTVASVRLVSSSAGPVLVTSGRTSAGDGGGGTWAWDPTSTDSDDGALAVAVTGVTTGRWKRQYSGPIDVRWFGAVGDGVTDDTAAIQAAIDAAVAAGGGTVWLPATRGYQYTSYRTTAPLTILHNAALTASPFGVVLKGDGHKRVGISYEGTADVAILKLWSRECVIEDLTFTVRSAVTMDCAIDVTQALVGSVITKNVFRRVSITGGYAGDLTHGIRFGERIGGNQAADWPGNCDYMVLEDVSIDNVVEACVYSRSQGGNAIFYHLHRCTFGFAKYAIDQTGTGFSFSAYHTGLSRISEVAFNFNGTPSDMLIIDGLDIEAVAKLFKGHGPTTGAWPVVIRGGRHTFSAVGTGSGYDLPADGRWIEFDCPGPLTLEGCLFFESGVQESTWNIYLGGNGYEMPSLTAIGCLFPRVTGGPDALITGRGRATLIGCAAVPASNVEGIGAGPIEDRTISVGAYPQGSIFDGTPIGRVTFGDGLRVGESKAHVTQHTASVSTTGHTATTADSFTPPANCKVTVTASADGVQSDGSDGWDGAAKARFLVAAGVVTQIGTTTAVDSGGSDGSNGCALTVDTDGTVIRTRVTGITGQTWRWTTETGARVRTTGA